MKHSPSLVLLAVALLSGAWLSTAHAIDTWPPPARRPAPPTPIFSTTPAPEPTPSLFVPLIQCEASFFDSLGGTTNAECAFSLDRANVTCCRVAALGECGISAVGCHYDSGSGESTICSMFSSSDFLSQIGYSTGSGPTLSCSYDNGAVAGSCDITSYGYDFRTRFQESLQATVCGSFNEECHVNVDGIFPSYRVGVVYDHTRADDILTCRLVGPLCSGQFRCENGDPSGAFNLLMPPNDDHWSGGITGDFDRSHCRCGAVLSRTTPCGNFLNLRLLYDTNTNSCSGAASIGIAR